MEWPNRVWEGGSSRPVTDHDRTRREAYERQMARVGEARLERLAAEEREARAERIQCEREEREQARKEEQRLKQ